MARTPPLHVDIPSYTIQSRNAFSPPHVDYVVRYTYHGIIHAHERRYSDFYKLYKKLEQSNDVEVEQLSFPKKEFHFPFTLPSRERLEERRIELERFLQEAVSASLSFEGTKAVDDFLKLNLDPSWEEGWKMTDHDFKQRFPPLEPSRLPQDDDFLLQNEQGITKPPAENEENTTSEEPTATSNSVTNRATDNLDEATEDEQKEDSADDSRSPLPADESLELTDSEKFSTPPAVLAESPSEEYVMAIARKYEDENVNLEHSGTVVLDSVSTALGAKDVKHDGNEDEDDGSKTVP